MNKTKKTAKNTAKATTKNCSAKTKSTIKDDCSKKGCGSKKTHNNK